MIPNEGNVQKRQQQIHGGLGLGAGSEDDCIGAGGVDQVLKLDCEDVCTALGCCGNPLN